MCDDTYMAIQLTYKSQICINIYTLTADNRSTQRKACTSATSSTTDPTQAGLWPNPTLCADSPVHNPP